MDLSRIDADVAVLGVPTDEGSPFKPGSRFGPRGIREQSLRFGELGYYDQRTQKMYLEYELEHGRITDVGDVDVRPTDVEGTFDAITNSMRDLLACGTLPVILGGDHAITYPVVRAYEKPLHVLHFDAHVDYSPFRHGYRNTNAHPFRHIRQMTHVESLTQVGIRSLRDSREAVVDAFHDNRVVTMEEFLDLGPLAFIESLPGNVDYYVSIDIDVLDLPLVPGCVSAEPSGMTYGDLRATLIALSEHAPVVGFDLVEVNPMLDVPTGVTSYIAAHTIVEFLGHICDQPRWIAHREDRAQSRRQVEESQSKD
jgi:agmatinase